MECFCFVFVDGVVEEDSSYGSYGTTSTSSSKSQMNGRSNGVNGVGYGLSSSKIDSFSPRGDPILPQEHTRTYSSPTEENWEFRKRKTARNSDVRRTLRRARHGGTVNKHNFFSCFNFEKFLKYDCKLKIVVVVHIVVYIHPQEDRQHQC